ncbi:hypothetical protein CQA66_05010 [Helicobacter aurati]|uniref:MATE family efflux transporter n=1 Tax=Helicobacter aurati TaxID=137778 RepID=A0A3D8J4I5_9HELI|nr:MATE family efflux transporter [Helicobacter aurati]RDU72422.1 hypothetical protein CQA66_05010 [Helicobacter aurati]
MDCQNHRVGRHAQGKEHFFLVVYVSLVCGIVIAILGLLSIRFVATSLGVEGVLLESCILYGQILLLALPASMLQFSFQCLFATAGKPSLGLVITLVSGIANRLLDTFFIVVFSWGIWGAAFTTLISQCIGGFLFCAQQS